MPAQNRQREKWANGSLFDFGPNRKMAVPYSSISQQVRKISTRVASSENIEVVDVACKGNPRRWAIKIFIDKPGGISHTDCELISNQVGTILDVEEVVSGSYTLEVSSPGLDRKLIRIEDYKRFSGKKVRLRLRHARDGRRQFTGRLRGFIDYKIALELSENKENKMIHVAFDDIENARLVVEL
ncbi:MAG: ribosome maturation factor [Solibacterales bacterium]|nr:ribosome maturation factor [Bryobacterales bacterium]